MNYYNCLCNGCGQPLREDDDIVVCPECGTPQHRECYKKENRCVNAHLHSDSFVWSPAEGHVPSSAAVPALQIPAKEKLPCPSCGHLNEPDAKVCESCSMKLIVLGMNLAQTAQETGHTAPASSKKLPDYPAPFVLGRGEGFEYDNAACEEPAAAADEDTPAEAPQEQAIRREQARQHLVLRFIGTNTERYLENFSRLESGRRARFNFAAFFFAPYWFFYRKLYKPGIIFLTVSFLHSIYFSPALSEYLTVVEKYRSMAQQLFTDEALYTAILNELAPLMPTVSPALITSLALKLIAGFIAYPLYKKYTDASVARIMSSPSAEAGLAATAKLGGTSFIGVFAAFFGTELLSYIVSMIMYGM